MFAAVPPASWAGEAASRHIWWARGGKSAARKAASGKAGVRGTARVCHFSSDFYGFHGRKGLQRFQAD